MNVPLHLVHKADEGEREKDNKSARNGRPFTSNSGKVELTRRIKLIGERQINKIQVSSDCS